MSKAFIAMSGGVDSSVAAFLTQQAGYQCIGCTMQLFDHENACGSSSDVKDARTIAARLGMDHYVLDFRTRFQEQVISGFCNCYLEGRTPNPCIECNRHLKFGALLEQADSLGCEKIVTGHYARIEETDKGYVLRRAANPEKDQSYVLYMLTQKQLSRVLLPLGEYSKPQIRKIAEEQGFVTAHKSDSQDICFVPDGDYASVIQKRTGIVPEEGDFIDTAGNVIGRHAGLIHYTLGQRRGLGIALGKPAYVVGLDVPQNRVIIGTNDDLFHRSCTIRGVNWMPGEPPQEPIRCQAKIRYRHTAQPAILQFTDEHTARLTFDVPQRAMTPGQAAVFYDDDTVLGGGEILGVVQT